MPGVVGSIVLLLERLEGGDLAHTVPTYPAAAELIPRHPKPAARTGCKVIHR
jgi:hypothetical protein